MNIILCGLPMCGKTTLGKMVAEKLNRPFIDTDQSIEKDYQKANLESLSCRQIFSKIGNDAFRKLEKQQLLNLKKNQNLIISLGGGCLIDPENRTLLKSIGRLYYLQSSPEILWKRTLPCGVPTFLDEGNLEKSFYNICEERIPIYETTADVILKIDGLAPEIILELILSSGI